MSINRLRLFDDLYLAYTHQIRGYLRDTLPGFHYTMDRKENWSVVTVLKP